ncbi:Catenin binding domain-containing protein [Dioscorea alata]|uniref:Catenin binding domain-containing protein n=1 Tax=Dioscorea alata TaxID=55571 RepID=A0ACB7VVX1_DIOAL|nr:Catenin binding domain-containing protein [Dioscorea alata]
MNGVLRSSPRNISSQLYRNTYTLNTQTKQMASVVELKRSLADLKSSLAREVYSTSVQCF